MDGQTKMTKLRVAFRSFANAPKNRIMHCRNIGYCTFYKNIAFTTVACFSDVCYHASHQDRKESGASATTVSQICAFTMLVDCRL